MIPTAAKTARYSQIRRKIQNCVSAGQRHRNIISDTQRNAIEESGWLTPRGPVTTAEAIVILIAAIGVGFASGWLLRSRGALLLAPVTFVVVFELARMRVDGPTVDGVRLDGIYGVIALVGGRGIDAVLILLRPASTAPIVGADGNPIPGSIAELVDVPIGGHDQAIMLRGLSRDAPVLLFLEGGPGGTGIGRIRNSGTDLERSFVVATSDQRGTGQMVDQFAMDKLMYAESIAHADVRGDTGTADTLRSMGPPPYEDTLDYPIAIASNPKWLNFEHGTDYQATSEYPASLFVPEYTLIEQLRVWPRSSRRSTCSTPNWPIPISASTYPASTCRSPSWRDGTRLLVGRP